MRVSFDESMPMWIGDIKWWMNCAAYSSYPMSLPRLNPATVGPPHRHVATIPPTFVGGKPFAWDSHPHDVVTYFVAS
jgi:hypothetical protein